MMLFQVLTACAIVMNTVLTILVLAGKIGRGVGDQETSIMELRRRAEYLEGNLRAYVQKESIEPRLEDISRQIDGLGTRLGNIEALLMRQSGTRLRETSGDARLAEPPPLMA